MADVGTYGKYTSVMRVKTLSWSCISRRWISVSWRSRRQR